MLVLYIYIRGLHQRTKRREVVIADRLIETIARFLSYRSCYTQNQQTQDTRKVSTHRPFTLLEGLSSIMYEKTGHERKTKPRP